MDFIIDNFDKLFDSEEHLKKLEEIILDLAVKGKLVPQNSDDEPASVLLEKIKAEKEKLIKEKKIKKDKELEPISEEEKPFEIPDSWEWVRLGDIVDFKIGKTPSRHNSEYWENGIYNWVSIADMSKSEYLIETKEKVTQKAFDDVFKENISIKGSLLMSFKLSIGKMTILKNDAFHNEAIVTLNPYYDEDDINKLYLFTCLCGFDLLKDTSDAIKGKTLNSTSMNDIILALPPLAEQKRIVEKVDSLKKLIDTLKEKAKVRDKTREELKKSIMAEIEKSDSNIDLLNSLEMVFKNFDTIVKNKEDIKDIRDLILSMAVKGKLVPQNSDDEPASVLLEKIKAEKEKLIKEKKIKKDKELEPISEEEKPFEIPDSWKWVRLGEISNYGNTISILPQNIDDNLWTLELEDIEKDSSQITKIIYNSERQVKSNKHCFDAGDVLYSKLRPYLKKILVAPQKGVCTSEIIPFRGYGNILSEYIVKVMKSNYIDVYVNSITHGMNMPRLGTENARNIYFPLPPLAEQKRIVEKVDKLMTLCDDLAKKIEKSQKEFEKILESAIKEVTANNAN